MLIVVFFFYREFRKQRMVLRAIRSKALELKNKNREEAISFLKKQFERVIEFNPSIFSGQEFKEFRQFLRAINQKRYPTFGVFNNSSETILISFYMEENSLEQSSDEISKEDLARLSELFVNAMLA